MRFYFDIHDDQGIWPDEEGQELASLQAAEIEAAKSLVGMAEAKTPDDPPHQMAVQVRTVDGPLFEAVFRFERGLLQ